MDLVQKTVRAWASTPFDYGATDCGLSVLHYAEAATGRAIAVRPTHKSRSTARLLLRLNGGFLRYASALARELGVERIDQAARGDIGLIDIPGQGLTMCLCLGASWIAKGNFEVLYIKDVAPVAAWKVPQCPKP